MHPAAETHVAPSVETEQFASGNPSVSLTGAAESGAKVLSVG
jgi:hypothetical protein